jgi:hypothetical protein
MNGSSIQLALRARTGLAVCIVPDLTSTLVGPKKAQNLVRFGRMIV